MIPEEVVAIEPSYIGRLDSIKRLLLAYFNGELTLTPSGQLTMESLFTKFCDHMGISATLTKQPWAKSGVLVLLDSAIEGS
jgi:hypothetical protein